MDQPLIDRHCHPAEVGSGNVRDWGAHGSLKERSRQRIKRLRQNLSSLCHNDHRGALFSLLRRTAGGRTIELVVEEDEPW